MEIRIEWSELSERQLKDIFDYYSVEAGTRIARKIINRILTEFPYMKTTLLLAQKKSC